MKMYSGCLSFFYHGFALLFSACPIFAQALQVDPHDGIVTTPNLLLRLDKTARVRELWRAPQAGTLDTQPCFFEFTLAEKSEAPNGAPTAHPSGEACEDSQSVFGDVKLLSSTGTVSARSDFDPAARALSVEYAFNQPGNKTFIFHASYPHLLKSAAWDAHAQALRLQVAWRTARGNLKTQGEGEFFIRTEPSVSPTLQSGEWVWAFKDAGDVRFVFELPPGKNRAPFADTYVRLDSDNARLDKLFATSVEQLRSLQFANNAYMTDIFWYRDAWIRDGVYAMNGLMLVGGHDAARAFYNFWEKKGGFSVGGEREAQQPAIMIMGLYFTAQWLEDGDKFLKRHWSYVAEFADYYARRIQKEGGMIDTAEEWICFVPTKSAWPNAEIYGGLRAAVKIARLLGDEANAARWDGAAKALEEDFIAHAYDEGVQSFIPLAGAQGAVFVDPKHPELKGWNGPLRDTRADSGMLILARADLFGQGQSIVAPTDARFLKTQARLERELSDGHGGLFRFGVNPDSPHSPKGEEICWPLTAMWRAQLAYLRGDRAAAWEILDKGVLNSPVYSLERYQWRLPEGWNAEGKPNQVFMLPWTNGEFLCAAFFLLTGANTQTQEADIGFSPWLPASMNRAKLSPISFRGWELSLTMVRENGAVRAELSGRRKKTGALERLRVQTPGAVVWLDDGNTVKLL